VIMKDLTKMYGGLYDLLNRNFTKKQKKEKDSNNEEKTVTQRTCYVYYAGTKQEVDVHENFKIIILTGRAFGKTEEEIQQNYPAPFLNRFEKFFITQAMLPSLIKSEKYLEIQSLKEDPQLVKLMKNNRFIGLSEDMIISGVDVDNSQNKEEDKRIVEALVQIKYGEENNELNDNHHFQMTKYMENNRGMFQLCHMATFNILLDTDEDKRNIFQAISNSKQFKFYFDRVKKDISTAQVSIYEKEETSKAILLTFSPITKDYEQQSTIGGSNFKHIMGIEFITKSTEEIKKSLKGLLEDKRGRSNLIIQLGSPIEFQKLQNIRVAIDEINSAALEITLSSKAGETSRSSIEEENRYSRVDENRNYSFANVLVIMHLSTHSIELKKLNTLPGLNFWFGWELRVIEKLDMKSVDVEIKRNLYRPLRFHELFVLNQEDKLKTDEITKQCEIGLREFQMTILGRLLFHEYHLFVRELVGSNAYLNLSSFNLGEVKRNLLPEMNGQERIKEGYFLRVFEQEMSSRIQIDETSKEWTKYLSQNTETKNNELRKGDERKYEDNEAVYVDIEKAISTAFKIENGAKIQAYLKYLMCPEHLNNLSAYILGCSNKVEGLNGPHDEQIEMFLTLEDYEFLDYIQNNHLDKYKDILGADENEWYERMSTEFKNTLKNPIYDFQMSLKAFLNNEENKFVSFSLKGKSNIKPTTYKLPIYKENYEQIQKIVEDFKKLKKFLFSYDFKDVKRIIKLYKKGKIESMESDLPTDNYQIEMNNFKNNEKLVNLIFDPEITKKNLPSWMVKGVYTEKTKEFFFDMFLDLIKTLFPDPTRPYSDQEYYAVFELITLCLREPSKEEAESPLFFFKGIFFAFEFLNSILKNIMMNIHNNDTELEYLKSNLKNLLEGQIKKPESQKKKSKGQEKNAEGQNKNDDPKQNKKKEPFSFILLDEMSTKVELRNLISNGIDIQKPQVKDW
jgi:hypothetical protein